MSYSITGVQANSIGFTFPAAEQASGGVIFSPTNKTTVNRGESNLPSADTTKIVTPNEFQTPSATHTVAPTATNSAAPVDTVTLSTVDKVRQLRGEGEGDAVIATTLNLPIKEVDSDLHVSTQTQQHLSFTVAPVISPLSTSASAQSETTVSASV